MLFYVAVAVFLATVALGSLLETFTAAYGWMLCVLTIATIFVGVRQSATKQKIALSVCLLLIVSLLAWGRLFMVQADWENTVSQIQPAPETRLVGVVNSEVDVRSNFQQFSLQATDGEILVRTDPYQALHYGDLVIVSGSLERPQAFATELGRTFDYPGYLQAKGIAHQMPFATVERVEPGHGQRWLEVLYASKQYFMSTIEHFLPEPAAGLGEGLLLGVKQALGEELEQAFRTTGIIHIVVLSGYNVMLVVAFVTTILSYFLGLRGRVMVGICAITIFAVLVGPSATVIRASIMASLYLLAQMLGRTYAVLRGLFLAAAVMVFVNPYILLYDIGFQLSFMATLGLLLVAPQFETLLLATPRLIGIRDFFIATVSTQIAVAPILLYQIGELSLVAVVVNMIVLPLVPFAMLGTFAVGMFGMVSTTAAWLLAYPSYLILQMIIVVALWFAEVPYATLTLPEFSVWWVAGAYVVMAGVLYLLHERRTYTAVVSQVGKVDTLPGWIIENEQTVLQKFMQRQRKNNLQS